MHTFQVGDKVQIPTTKSTGTRLKFCDVISHALQNRLDYLTVLRVDRVDDGGEYLIGVDFSKAGFFKYQDLVPYQEETNNNVRTVREIFYSLSSNESYGIIGEYTGVLELHVGDIVVYLSETGNLVKTFVAKYQNKYTLMGCCGRELSSLVEKGQITKVVECEIVNDDMLKYVRNSSTLIIKEYTKVDLTLEEIEEKLGYKINIVGGKK